MRTAVAVGGTVAVGGKGVGVAGGVLVGSGVEVAEKLLKLHAVRFKINIQAAAT